MNMLQEDSPHGSPDSPNTPESIPLTPVNTRRETHLRFYHNTPPRSRPYEPTSPATPQFSPNPDCYEIIDLIIADAYVATLPSIPEDPIPEDLEIKIPDTMVNIQDGTLILDARQMDYLMRSTIMFNSCHNYGAHHADVSLIGYYHCILLPYPTTV